MQITFPPRTRQPAGYALIIIMVSLAVMLTVFASMMYWVSSNANITLRNNAFNQAEAAAESATETVLAPMIRDYDSGGLNDVSVYTNQVDQTGWPISYTISSANLVIDRTHDASFTALASQFAGLSGYVDFVTNIITATANNGPVSVPATVEQDLQFAACPVFQYAIFYNMDLEICPGAAMAIGGHVHSNNNIYYTGNSSSQQLTFSNLVDSTGFSTNSRSPNDPQSFSTGNVVFKMAGQPLQKVPGVTMPVGNNNNPTSVVAIIQIPPSTNIVPADVAYSDIGKPYLYNTADLIITNNGSAPFVATNFTVLYDNKNTSPRLMVIQPDVQVVVSNYNSTPPHTPFYTTNATWYSFVTNATFFDYREGKTVKAIQIDVGKLNAWLINQAPITNKIGLATNIITGGTNFGVCGYQYNQWNTTSSSAKGHNINSIYVYNSIPPTSTTLPAVRLVNGSQLPSTSWFGNGQLAGLTVASAQPIYTLGNYNVTNNGAVSFTLGSTTTGGAVPASLIADALTVLSQNWSDSYSLSHTGDTTPTGRPAVNTTINIATLEGIVQSVTANGNKQYSGGVENFLRMLEDWQPSSPGQQSLTYNGSIVVLFPSQYATNYWIGPGTYYNPPNRQWGFDMNFLNGQNAQPPLSPQFKEVIRSSFSAW
jgi:hypothetical protein